MIRYVKKKRRDQRDDNLRRGRPDLANSGAVRAYQDIILRRAPAAPWRHDHPEAIAYNRIWRMHKNDPAAAREFVAQELQKIYGPTAADSVDPTPAEVKKNRPRGHTEDD